MLAWPCAAPASCCPALPACRLGRLLYIEVRGVGQGFADAPGAPLTWRQNADYSGLNVLGMGIFYEALQRSVCMRACSCFVSVYDLLQQLVLKRCFGGESAPPHRSCQPACQPACLSVPTQPPVQVGGRRAAGDGDVADGGAPAPAP